MHTSPSRIIQLLYVHGVCESAETWAVQSLAKYCAQHRWRLVVLELAGHGLSGDVGSTENRAGKGRAVCPDFDALVAHVVQFTMRMGSEFSRSKGMALCGSSLGGALVAYATRGVMCARREGASAQEGRPNFYGACLLAPSLGIRSAAIPPSPVILALRTLSHLLPSQGILTPVEHPEQYACPPSSTRNFSGRWPLSTSNMLLKLTSERIPNDVESGKVSQQMEGLPSLLVMIGEKDEIIPLSSVTNWFEAVTSLSSDNGEKKIIVLEGAGHGFIHERREGRKRKIREQCYYGESLFEWLNGLAIEDFQ